MKIKETILEHAISHLIELCKGELNLDQLPKITLVNKEYIEGNGKRSFGVFGDDSIFIATKNRHPVDVARTLAHELVHWKQQLMNMEMDGSDGSVTENQANSVAGIIMRKYSEKYPEYFLGALPD